jgi:hypothetical protein
MFIVMGSLNFRTPLGVPCSRWSRRFELERAGVPAVIGVRARGTSHT